MVDASSMGSFPRKQVNDKRDIIESIQRKIENWKVDKGKELGINYEYYCIKSIVETNSLMSLVLNSGLILT